MLKFKYYGIGQESKRVVSKIYNIAELEAAPHEYIWNFAERLAEPLVTSRKQYTRVLDKNKNEIYSGDIVRISINDEEEDCAWITQVGVFGNWNDIKVYNGNNIDFLPINYAYDVLDCEIEIIGNIYENLNLLEMLDD